MMRPTTMLRNVFALAFPLACVTNAPPAPEATTKRSSAVTASEDTRAEARKRFPNDIGPPPGTPPPKQIPRPPDVSASQHPGHFSDKVVDKTAAQTPTSAPPAVSAAYVAKQRDYLARWDELRRTIAGLPQKEQDARRADLKRTALGD